MECWCDMQIPFSIIATSTQDCRELFNCWTSCCAICIVQVQIIFGIHLSILSENSNITCLCGLFNLNYYSRYVVSIGGPLQLFRPTISVGWFLLLYVGQKVQGYFSSPVCPWLLLSDSWDRFMRRENWTHKSRHFVCSISQAPKNAGSYNSHNATNSVFLIRSLVPRKCKCCHFVIVVWICSLKT